MAADNALWEDILHHVAGDGEVDPYLEQARGEFLDGSVLRISVASAWARRTIEDRHLARIRSALRDRFPDDSVEVRVVVDEELVARPLPADRESLFPAHADDGPDDPTELAPDDLRRELRPRVVPEKEPDRTANLNPRYTFDRFVIGSSNRLAYAAALTVAENPDGKSINPMLLYGGVGLGKTHLLHAIGNLIRSKQPALKVLYVSAETFTNELVEAIRLNATGIVRNKYRTVDVLLMDDIQFLQRKPQSQIEMVHTFNDMYNANKQIILASDSYPKDMPALEERLKSRFMGGMLTSIDPPEVETRIAILQRKAEDIGIERLPDDVALYIAERVATNIRELEGALSTACRHAQLRGQELTLALARDVLRNRDEEEDSYRQPVTVDLIQRTVADHFQLKHTELKAKRRTKRVATARHVAMFLCRQLTDLSFVDIGQDFGGRDHSTVISACDKIERESQRSAQLSRLLEELREQVLGKHRRPRRGAM